MKVPPIVNRFSINKIRIEREEKQLKNGKGKGKNCSCKGGKLRSYLQAALPEFWLSSSCSSVGLSKGKNQESLRASQSMHGDSLIPSLVLPLLTVSSWRNPKWRTLLHELEAQNVPLFLSTLFGVSHSPQLARSYWLLLLRLLLNVHLMIVSNKPALPTKTFSFDFSYCITFPPRGCVSCVCMCTAYRQM